MLAGSLAGRFKRLTAHKDHSRGTFHSKRQQSKRDSLVSLLKVLLIDLRKHPELTQRRRSMVGFQLSWIMLGSANSPKATKPRACALSAQAAKNCSKLDQAA